MQKETFGARTCKHRARDFNQDVEVPVVITQTAHERLTKAAKICAVVHFLCENICDICLSADMRDGESATGDPFTNWVIGQLYPVQYKGIFGTPNKVR